MFHHTMISTKSNLLGSLICLAAVILAACTTPALSYPDRTGTAVSPPSYSGQAARLTVFAAASLTDAFRDVGQEFERAYPGTRVTFNFAGSQQLALQIEQGAPADLFASADQRTMDRLVGAGLIDRTDIVTFAHNRMVVILPADNPGQVETLEDLARPGLKLLLAGPQVPAGAYARQVLDNLAADLAYGPSFTDAVLRNLISNEENVKQVLAKVQLGEADAGMVYSSDVTPGQAGQLRWIEVPDRFNVEAAYPIAVVGSASAAALARQFVQFVLGSVGQHILEQWGLIPATQGGK
jgi:molybdate transport system substrate-binding protein